MFPVELSPSATAFWRVEAEASVLPVSGSTTCA